MDNLKQFRIDSDHVSETDQQSVGQVVPQDTNDKPVSVLLERIRAERTAQGNGKAKRGRGRGRPRRRSKITIRNEEMQHKMCKRRE